MATNDSIDLFGGDLLVTTRKCSRCKESKPLVDFYKKKRSNWKRRWPQKAGFTHLCRLCMTIATMERRRKDPEKTRERSRHANLKHSFNLTPEAYSAMLEAQQGLCAICKQPETHTDPRTKAVKHLAVDHDHTTGRIRALLCNACNAGLGGFRDNCNSLRNAIVYLESFRK